MISFLFRRRLAPWGMNVPSLQYPRGSDNIFGFVKDSFPDRWGRLLLDQLIDPGTSLGGARPKANVVDTDGRIFANYIAEWHSTSQTTTSVIMVFCSPRKC